MKKINYNIYYFNTIFRFDLPNQSYNKYIDIIFGDDWAIFDLLQFAMFDNDF
jgi:hypothetical protein